MNLIIVPQVDSRVHERQHQYWAHLWLSLKKKKKKCVCVWGGGGGRETYKNNLPTNIVLVLYNSRNTKFFQKTVQTNSENWREKTHTKKPHIQHKATDKNKLNMSIHAVLLKRIMLTIISIFQNMT